MLNYFAPVRRWGAVERRALRWVRGRVLDAGVGAGRVALELQERGREVVAIDVSPGAVQVARRRGVRDARLLALEDVDESLGEFDTLVMFGNNFGLFRSRAKARHLLRQLRPFVRRIVATSNDPSGTDDPVHSPIRSGTATAVGCRASFGCASGYRDLIGPWFDYLIVSPDEMAEIVEGTGWEIRHLIRGEGTFYVAVLEQRGRARASAARADRPPDDRKRTLGGPFFAATYLSSAQRRRD
jgi:SAM-dependent methyltransferase